MSDKQQKPHIEKIAQHPQSPSAKWQRFQSEIADEATRTATVRDARDRERTDGTDYTRTQRGEQTGGS